VKSLLFIFLDLLPLNVEQNGALSAALKQNYSCSDKLETITNAFDTSSVQVLDIYSCCLKFVAAAAAQAYKLAAVLYLADPSVK
jgi:hypothetical protein